MAADVQVRVRVDAKETISQLDAIKQKLGAADTYANQVTAAFNRQQTAVKKLTASWAKLNAVEARASKSTNATSGTTKRLKTEYTGLNKALGMTNTKVKQYNWSIKTGSTETKKAAVAVSTLSTNLWNLNEASRAVSHMWRIILGYYMATRLSEIAAGFERAAESVSLLDKKLQHFTHEASALEQVKETAWQVGVNFDTLGKIITRFSVATKDAFSVDEMLKWSEGIIKSARAVGTTTQELNSGLIQLSQAMSAGRLMGDEYRSISENLPMLKVELENVFAATEHAGVGLKKLSSEGLITVDVMTQAFEALYEKMEDMPGVTDTIDANWERVRTQWASLMETIFNGEDTFTGSALYVFAETLKELSGGYEAKYLEQTIDGFEGLSKALEKPSDAAMILAESFRTLGSAITLASKLLAAFLVYKLAGYLSTAATAAYALGEGLIALIAPMAAVSAGAKATAVSMASIVASFKLLGVVAVVTASWWLYEKAIKASREAEDEFNESAKETKKALLANDTIQLSIAKANALQKMTDIQAKINAVEKERIAIEQRPSGALQQQALAMNMSTVEVLLSRYEDYKVLVDDISEKQIENTKALHDGTIATASLTQANREFRESLAKISPEYKNILDYLEAFSVLHTLKLSKQIDTEDYARYLAELQKKYFSTTKAVKGLSDAQREYNALVKKAASLAEGVEDPLQKYERQMQALEKFTKLKGEDALSTETLIRLQQKYALGLKEGLVEKEKTTVIFNEGIVALAAETEMLLAEAQAYNEGTEAVRQFAKEKMLLAAIEEAKGNATPKEIARMREQIDLYFEAVDALKVSKTSHEKYLSFSQDFANQYKEIFKDLFNDVGENLRSLFSDMFAGTEDAFENFTDRITRLFTDMLADLAYAALVQPIVMQLQYAVSGGGAGAPGGSGTSLLSGGGQMSWANAKNLLSGSPVGSAATPAELAYAARTPTTGQFAGHITDVGAMPGMTPQYGLSGGANIGMMSLVGGYTAGQVGGIGGVAAGGLAGVGSVALTSGLLGSGGTVGALAGGMGSFGGAAMSGLGAIPVAGWAALGASLILSSGILDGNSDVTPDLSVWQSQKTRPELLWQDTEDGETDISFQAGSRFGGVGIMTQHDLFGSQDDATEYFEYVSSKLNLLDEAIFMAIDAETSAAIEKAMNTNWLSAEKYEDGGFDIETVLEKRFDRIFDSMNNSLEGTYEKLRNLGASYDSAATSAIIYENVTHEAQVLLDDLWLNHMGFLTEVGAEGEDFAQTALRLAGQLGTVNTYFEAMGFEMLDLTTTSADFVNRLAEISGGFDSLVVKMDYFYANFFSESEQLDMTINQSREAITEFSEEWGTGFLTKESLRELMGAQDLLTDSGVKLTAALLDIAPAVNSFYTALDEQAAPAIKAAEEAKEAKDKIADDAKKAQDKLDEDAEKARVKQYEEDMASYKESMLVLAGYVSVDLPTAFARGNESIWQSYDRNLQEMAALSATFDYSVDAMASMATLVADTRQLELEMLQQIKDLSESVAESIAATTKEWLIEDMTPQEEYDYLEQDSYSEYAAMRSSKTAAEAYEHWSNINSNIGRMREIQKSEEERVSTELKDVGWTEKNGLTGYLDSFNFPTTEEWIAGLKFTGIQYEEVSEGIRQGVEDNATMISDAIVASLEIDRMALAADTQLVAANKMDLAADKMTQIAVSLSEKGTVTLSEGTSELDYGRG